MSQAKPFTKIVSAIVALCLLALVACGPDTEAGGVDNAAPTPTTQQLVLSPTVARDDPGIFDDRIVFGQSAAFTGPDRKSVV